jgi:predicted branched-subunit amino acid permease
MMEMEDKRGVQAPGAPEARVGSNPTPISKNVFMDKFMVGIHIFLWSVWVIGTVGGALCFLGSLFIPSLDKKWSVMLLGISIFSLMNFIIVLRSSNA